MMYFKENPFGAVIWRRLLHSSIGFYTSDSCQSLPRLPVWKKRRRCGYPVNRLLEKDKEYLCPHWWLYLQTGRVKDIRQLPGRWAGWERVLPEANRVVRVSSLPRGWRSTRIFAVGQPAFAIDHWASSPTVQPCKMGMACIPTNFLVFVHRPST